MTPYDQRQTVRIHQIKVYSNIIPTEAPAAVTSVINDIFKIHLSNQNILLSTEANVELFSLDGKKVFKGYTKLVDVSSFNRGIYIIRAIGNDGKIQNKKIAI